MPKSKRDRHLLLSLTDTLTKAMNERLQILEANLMDRVESRISEISTIAATQQTVSGATFESNLLDANKTMSSTRRNPTDSCGVVPREHTTGDYQVGHASVGKSNEVGNMPSTSSSKQSRITSLLEELRELSLSTEEVSKNSNTAPHSTNIGNEIQFNTQNRPSFSQHLISTFDGSSPWFEYERLLDETSIFYGWSKAEKRMALVSNLRGAALKLYGTLPVFPPPTYEEICNLLRKRYTLDPQACYQRFRNYVQGPNESLADFATELERFAMGAFSGTPNSIASDILKNQFVDGLRDTYLQNFLIASRPKDIYEALQVAQELQARSSRHRPRQVYELEPIDSRTTNNRRRGGNRSRSQPNEEQGNEEPSA